MNFNNWILIIKNKLNSIVLSTLKLYSKTFTKTSFVLERNSTKLSLNMYVNWHNILVVTKQQNNKTILWF
jgi:hypothetical protein